MGTVNPGKYELLFSDLVMGHPDLGWMPRDMVKLQAAYGVEDEDQAYCVFLNDRGITAAIMGGYAWVK